MEIRSKQISIFSNVAGAWWAGGGEGGGGVQVNY